MKKTRLWFLLVLLLLAQLWGCQKQEAEEADYQIYYINKDDTAVVSENYEPENTEGTAMIEEFIGKLQETPENPEYKKALPDSVKLLDYYLEDGQMSLYFDVSYQLMDEVYEVLCRAAIVRTVCQLPQVDYVAFFVNDEALVDSNDMPVGFMTAELFIENAGQQINTYDRVTLSLYFANEEGDKLVRERDTFNYSTNISLEKLVVEQLIKGPLSDQAYPCIPPETKLLSVTTKDGICYVNLDAGFMGQGYDVKEAIPIYSIVNSLTQLQHVKKVQILINGETPKVYRESISFTTIFEFDFRYIETEGNSSNKDKTQDTQEETTQSESKGNKEENKN